MRDQIQVKGTLPLIADFLNTTESRIYDVFNLNIKTKAEIRKEQKGGESDGLTDKGKTIPAPKDSI